LLVKIKNHQPPAGMLKRNPRNAAGWEIKIIFAFYQPGYRGAERR
jgi:hypothetical protein